MRRSAAALLLCACGAPAAPVPVTPMRDDPAQATARFSVDLLPPDHYHELELHRPDGSAAVIWSPPDTAGARHGTTRLDLRQPEASRGEFTVDPSAEQAVYLRDGRIARTAYVLMLPGVCTRLRP